MSDEPTATEAAVLEWWQERLPRPATSLDDDFFDLDGESLDLIWFLSRVHDVFGVELPVAELFATGFTAAQVAGAVDAAVRGKSEVDGGR